jgi:hypothetical protein
MVQNMNTLSYRLGSYGYGVQFCVGARVFPPLHSIHTGCGAHPASYPVITGAVFTLGVKHLGHAADHTSLSSAKVKDDGAIPSLFIQPMQGS